MSIQVFIAIARVADRDDFMLKIYARNGAVEYDGAGLGGHRVGQGGDIPLLGVVVRAVRWQVALCSLEHFLDVDLNRSVKRPGIVQLVERSLSFLFLVRY